MIPPEMKKIIRLSYKILSSSFLLGVNLRKFAFKQGV